MLRADEDAIVERERFVVMTRPLLLNPSVSSVPSHFTHTSSSTRAAEDRLMERLGSDSIVLSCCSKVGPIKSQATEVCVFKIGHQSTTPPPRSFFLKLPSSA